MYEDLNDHAEQLFSIIDLDGSGFIDESELAQICGDLPLDELKEIFQELDKDGDGKISHDEFKVGFKDVYKNVKRRRHSSKASADDVPDLDALDDFVGSLDEGLKALTCQEQVCDLYQQLHASDNPELLQHFESIILGVIKDVSTYKVENQRLEKTFKKEKIQHDKHLRQLEEEMEREMSKMEERIREKEQRKVQQEKAQLKKELETELLTCQQSYNVMQQEGLGKENKEMEEQLLNLQKSLNDISVENRQLRSELTDNKTNMAVVRTELSTFKQSYNEKVRELHLEKATVADIIKEQDNLTRQLHLLHNANKQLHDHNDDLIESFEKRAPNRQLSSVSLPNSIAGDRRGSLMSDYLPSGPSSHNYLMGYRYDYRVRSLNISPTPSLAEDLQQTNNVSVNAFSLPGQSPRVIRAILPRDETCEDDDADEIADSGHSTLRDLNDDSDPEGQNPDDDYYRRSHHNRRHRRESSYIRKNEENDSHDEVETESEMDQLHSKPIRRYDPVRLSSGSNSSRKSRTRSKNRDRDRDTDHGGRSSPAIHRHSLIRKTSNGSQERSANRDPDRMYKIVLAGDAAVGKSCFIMRLCKGKFVSNLSSTLGVDFQTKVLEVDDKTVALQLWDTAGQERFRSIAKSYFRRADGVFLLYDCTYERSFLSIREWVEAIEDGAQKKIPIMLIGNKTDMRPEAEKQGRRVVASSVGQKLAKDVSALFIETSAKDGSNITEAITELTRLMRANEDLEVKTVGLQLHEKPEDKRACCGR
ncbi:ras and EF-hand domain-containing protein homolog isoform X1 [Mytilus edulis]|uniref:ras and EF-hand domain-containing protein homolog isoform X1 n=1 Tax=Mytilus edulis TaxID=6550 RepID=UPI0039EFE964